MFPTDLPYTRQSWIETIYPSIRDALGIPAESDQEVLDYWLDRGLQPRPLPERLTGGKAIILAAGPQLEQYNLQEITTGDTTLITADGATRWLLEQDVQPDIVVTDLDGLTMDHFSLLADRETQIYVLIHGDNSSRMEELWNAVDCNDQDQIYFTTQGPTYHGFPNTLGFTDGDRAVALAHRFKLTPYLMGFDLTGDLIGRYSKPGFKQHQPMTERKRKKLDIAHLLLQWMERVYPIFHDPDSNCPGMSLELEDFLPKY